LIYQAALIFTKTTQATEAGDESSLLEQLKWSLNVMSGKWKAGGKTLCYGLESTDIADFYWHAELYSDILTAQEMIRYE
jgi:hypothetical protein